MARGWFPQSLGRVPAMVLNSRPALKVIEFQKLKKALNCFGKRMEGLEKFGNLSIVKVSTRLGDCVNCHIYCKAGKITA